MLTMLKQVGAFIYETIWPQTQIPPKQFFGFLWQPEVGVPDSLSIYDGSEGSGVYVGFNITMLDCSIDFFGRLPGEPGTVFIPPAAPSAAVTQIVNQLIANPPPTEEQYLYGLTQQRLQDITGFLDYVNTCLSIIYQTTAGAALFSSICEGQYPVRITIGRMSNQTFPCGPDFMNTLAKNLIDYGGQQPLDNALVNSVITAQYTGTAAEQYDQLANDINSLPLYSLFEDPAQSQPNYLNQYFNFAGQPVTGQELMAWLSQNGFPAFNTNVLTFDTSVQGVLIRQYFLLALIMLLFNKSPASNGAGSVVLFCTLNVGDNEQGTADYRPPAIGLAHELVHAMYYGQGTAPGLVKDHFSTTAAELLIVGLGPFAGQLISENAVRAEWGDIGEEYIDASNTWNHPVPRTIYEAPGPDQTPAQLRHGYHCI